MTAEEFRRMALSLPEVAEGAHNVQLRTARKAAVREALMTAWRNRAPKRVVSQLPPE
jgi:hypothetical protein